MHGISLFDALSRATCDHYEILRELGRGGMATVFAARDRALDRVVAIKVMAPELLTTPGMVERFLREARTVAKLRHPNIIAIHQIAAQEGLYYFVMEYVDGRTLAALIEEGRARGWVTVFESAVNLLAQAARGLQYAHDLGVVHRDVKPANIMIDAQAKVVVTDFGIAKLTQDAGATNTIIGTPTYMSPEQCQGTEAGPASDQYSLGVVAYEMITGAPPFGGGYATVMQAHATGAPPEIAALRCDCPPAIAAVVYRMLAKRPADRFHSIEKAARALEAAVAPADSPAAVTPTLPPITHAVSTTSPDAQRHGRWASVRLKRAVLVAMGILIVAVTTVALSSRTSTVEPGIPVPPRPSAPPTQQPPREAGSPDDRRDSNPGDVDSLRLQVSRVGERLRNAEDVSARGDYKEAAELLTLVVADAQALAERYPAQRAVDSLARSVMAAVRTNTERCEAYAALLRRRERTIPRCPGASSQTN
jgi:serine/threonine protein kinase